MSGLLAVVAGLAVFGGVLVGLVRLGSRVRRRGIGDAVMGPLEEMWHPAGHRARVEVRVQEELAIPAPSPGDGERESRRSTTD